MFFLRSLQVHDWALALLFVVVLGAEGTKLRHGHGGASAANLERDRTETQPPAAPPSPPPVAAVTRALVRGDVTLRVTVRGASPQAARLRAGSIVELLGKADSWHSVRSSGGREGWVDTSAILVQGDSAADAVLALAEVGRAATVKEEVKAGSSGRLHAAPGKQPFGSFARGEALQVLERRSDWVLVAVADGGGGRVVGFARAADVRSRADARALAATPAGARGAGPARPASAASEPVTIAPGPDMDTARPKAAAQREDADASRTDAAARIESLLAEGKAAYVSKDHAAAIDLAERVLALQPGNQTARRLAGLAACENGDVGAGLRHARKLAPAARAKVERACGVTPPDCDVTPTDPGCTR